MAATPRASSRIPSLDGLRAVAISLVLVCHLASGIGSSATPRLEWAIVLGDLGVRIFFVLSGYLITSLLLAELDASGRINLLRFYYRRTLRIFPAFYTFIAIVALAAGAGLLPVPLGNPLPAAAYISDYLSPNSTLLGHTWSLAVEEQFYLLWPATLLLWGKRRGLGTAVVIVLLAPVIRLVTWYLLFRHHAVFSVHGMVPITSQFHTQVDALATGCLLAGLRPWLHQQHSYRALLRHRAFFLVPLAVLGIEELGRGHFTWAYLLFLSLGVSALNLLLVLCLDWCLTYPGGIVGRILNARPIAVVGVLSYSLYIWQQLFLPTPGSWYQRPPMNLVFVFVAGAVSYVFVERPFLRLRARLEPSLFHRIQYRKSQPESQETPSG